MAEHHDTTLFRNLNALGVIAVGIVLLTAFYDQLTGGGLPCPLCLLQRIGFVGVLVGLLLNVIRGPKPDHYSIMIVSAFFGAAVSLRQITLHIVPPDPGYGGTFLGYHYYTWAFIVFAAIILGTALIAAYSTQYHKQRYIRFGSQNALGKTAIVLAIGVVAANVLSTFAECGPGQCPDNPVSYWLFG